MNPALPWPAPNRPAPAAPAYRVSAALATLVVAGAAVSDYLFWREGAGVNVLVYMVLLVAAHLGRLPCYAPVRRRAGFWVAVGGCLFSGGCVGWYGSAAALWAALASALLLLGLLNQPGLRLVSSAVLTALGNLLPAGQAVLGSLRTSGTAAGIGLGPMGGGRRRAWYYGRLLALPLLALLVFHALFVVANPRYADLSARLGAALTEALGRLLAAVSLPHLLFFGGCLGAAVGALVLVPGHFWADRESRRGEFVRRQRDGVASLGVRRPDFRPVGRGPLDLRREWLAAVGCLGLLNGLLAVENALDIRWLWFGFTPAPGFDLTQFVHEGTYVLILSILLAAGLLLWFFRRNLNFYRPGLPLLRSGATLWVAQNLVLAASVGLRNYYYIHYTELAYKRIGVYGFLLLTVFGLGTVLLKIWQRRSAFSLVRLNSWAAYALLLGLAAGNWEPWIAEYNLQPCFATLDAGLLLQMPNRVLPVLAAREALLDQIPALLTEGADGYSHPMSRPEAHERLHQRLAAFRAQQPDWQSRTGAEWRAHQKLHGHE